MSSQFPTNLVAYSVYSVRFQPTVLYFCTLTAERTHYDLVERHERKREDKNVYIRSFQRPGDSSLLAKLPFKTQRKIQKASTHEASVTLIRLKIAFPAGFRYEKSRQNSNIL